jgi:ABC-type uncharacterized transport system involved in gliding motility auxiliary subunit
MISQRLQKLTGIGLYLAVIVLAGWASTRFTVAFDWTAGGRNTLTEASQRQLEGMPDEIVFRAFVYSGDPLRRSIEQDLARYTRVKPNIRIEFIDPSTQPQAVREFEIRQPGQIVIEYQGRREIVPGTTEVTISTALQRLAYGGEQWVVFLSGHGERGIDDPQDARALTDFAELLRQRGLKVQRLNLVESPSIPDSTRVLVIASPERDFLPGEIELVREYLAQGGNLLWLADPESPAGLSPIAEKLGIRWLDGYAIFPEYQLLGTGHPGFFAAIGYPQHPVTQGFDQVTLFPLVRALLFEDEDQGWQRQPLLVTSAASWLETGDITGGAVALDDDDIPGPLLIGTTLTRSVGEGEAARVQRVGLIGDVDFLSNLHLRDLGNQAFGLNLLQWLALRDAQLNIEIPRAPDTVVLLSPWAGRMIVIGFVLVLPALLLGFGVTRWALRRRR